MSDSEAKPPPIGEGAKARRRPMLKSERKYENKYVKVTKSLSRLQRERRRYGVTVSCGYRLGYKERSLKLWTETTLRNKEA